ncbi:MAG: DUF5668 domain-containing protein [Anaerolineae bacterium]|nr:DUF5668 domain-containing protein [Anaerolineae bacterium]
MGDLGMRIYGTEQRTEREDHRPRPGLFWPLALVTAGVLLLLSNLGLVRVAWWELWRLWPLLLVFVGLDILSRHSVWAGAIVAVIALAVVGWAVYLMCTSPRPASPLYTLGSDELVATRVTESLGDAREVEVDLRMSVGELHLAALEDSPHLLEADLSYPRQGALAPRVSYGVSSGRGHLRIESRRNEAELASLLLRPMGEIWKVGLSREVPLSIRLEPGASSAILDLSRLRLRELYVDAGAGRLDVRFPAEGANMAARIEGGVGEVVLSVPESLPARIRVDGGLRSIQASSRFVRQGEAYETAGFAGAESRLDVLIDGGVGLLRIESS